MRVDGDLHDLPRGRCHGRQGRPHDGCGSRGRAATGGDRALARSSATPSTCNGCGTTSCASPTTSTSSRGRPGVGSQDRAGGPGEIVFIPDEDYDPSMWADAEDEGVGPRAGGTEVTQAPFSGGVHAPGRARIAARTLREDRWWLQPFVTFVCFSLGCSTAWSARPLQKDYFVEDYGYLTPFASPCRQPVLRAGVRPTSGRGSGSVPPLIPLAVADAAVPAALPADLLLLPQGLLPLVLAVAAGLRRARGAPRVLGRDPVPPHRPEPPPLLLLRRGGHLASSTPTTRCTRSAARTAASGSAWGRSSCSPTSSCCGATPWAATPAATSSAAGSTTSAGTRCATRPGAGSASSTPAT